MTDTNHAGNRRFAHNLFSAKDEDGDLVRGALDAAAAADDKQRDADDAADAEGRRFAADLFAPDDPDANVLAGLTDGRTVGRTTP